MKTACLFISILSIHLFAEIIDHNYQLPLDWEHAKKRLEVLEALTNPNTFRYLNEVGIQPNFECLEVGTGLGGVAKWLENKVPLGHVTATDINTRFLALSESPSLKLLQHNIVEEPLTDTYHLIHVRNVLMHLPEKDKVIKKLVDALKPGGILIVNDMGVFDHGYRLKGLDADQKTKVKEASDYAYLEHHTAMSFYSGYDNHLLFRQYGLVDIKGTITAKLVSQS